MGLNHDLLVEEGEENEEDEVISSIRQQNMGSQEVPIIENGNRSQQQQAVAIIDASTTTTTTTTNRQTTYKLSKQRWLILFAMTIYGVLSAVSGELSAILRVMLELLNLPTTKYIYIGQLFMYIPAISTIPIAWLLDRYGLRIIMYAATLLMLIRSIFRALMFYPEFPNWDRFKLTYWIISGLASTQSAAIFFCLPLKVSENWFAESERSIAWTIMISSYGLGSTLGSFTFPRFIQHVSDVKPLAYLNFVGGIIVSIVIVSCITRSKPKHPPSERTIKSLSKNSPWLVSIKKLFLHRDIMLHVLHGAIYDGMIMSVSSVIQEILVASGHSEIFVGNLLAMNSLMSIVILIVLAAFVHRITNVTYTCKVAAVIRVPIFIIHLLTLLYPTKEWIILSVSVLYNICSSWALPNNNNMLAHMISGAVSEATMAGVSATIYVLMITIGQVLFVAFRHLDSKGKPDYTDSIIFASVVCIVNSLIYISFFRGQPAKKDNTDTRRDDGEADRVSIQNLTEPHDNQAFDRVVA